MTLFSVPWPSRTGGATVDPMIESDCPQDCGGVLRFDLATRIHGTKTRCDSKGPTKPTCRAWWWWDASYESWLPMSAQGALADRRLQERRED